MRNACVLGLSVDTSKMNLDEMGIAVMNSHLLKSEEEVKEKSTEEQERKKTIRTWYK